MKHGDLSRIFLFFFAVVAINASTGAKFAEKTRNISAEPSMYKFNINKISTFIYADGRADLEGLNPGFEYPKGSNMFAVFASGLVWGGVINNEIRLGGSTFNSGLVPGKLGQNPEESKMYRVRTDYATGSMMSEINDEEKNGDETAIRAQYRLDWDEWPWQDGAPYLDANKDGQYTPDPDGNATYNFGEDVPGYPGAGQTIFFISNAANSEKTQRFYGSQSQEIELHTTIWGYSTIGPLGSTIYKKYKLINRGQEDYTDFYISVWSDPDIGFSEDDFVGCDTTTSLPMAYAYNASSFDAVYGDNPPACGHILVQGPIVPSPGNVAYVGDEHIRNWKNLKMTSFYYFANEQGTPYSDPNPDDYETGALYFYDLLQGRIPSNGELFPIPDELGGGKTKYPLSGDPVTGTGYLDGIIKPAADRRYGMVSGPFTLAANDAQEIVIAQVATQNFGNIVSVKVLKSFTEHIVLNYYIDNFGETNRYEPNDNITLAYGPISSSQWYTAYIGSPTDIDWYKFTVPSSQNLSENELVLQKEKMNMSGLNISSDNKMCNSSSRNTSRTESNKTTNLEETQVTIDLYTPMNNNYDLELFDSTGTVIDSATSNTDEQIIRTLSPGTYYILVYSHSGDYSRTECYSLKSKWNSLLQKINLTYYTDNDSTYVEPLIVSPGESFTTHFRVQNKGTFSSGDFIVEIIMTDSLKTTTYKIGQISVSSLNGGNSQNLIFSGKVPDIPEGVYYILHNIDPENLIKETDETDNSIEQTLTVLSSLDISNSDNIFNEFNLAQNYPNPFNPTTTIIYSIPESNNTRLTIYDILGREVSTLVNGFNKAGQHEIIFDAQDLPSGVYFYTLQCGNFLQTKKLLLLR